MKRRLFLSVVAMLAMLSAFAVKLAGYSSTPLKSTGFISFRVTAVDFRNDLTRVYGQFVGKPHTSERVDELLLVSPEGKQYKATDIDGVDMNRWFQWEDDGVIEVEIDFPAMKQLNSFQLKSTGPKGESATQLKRVAKKRK